MNDLIHLPPYIIVLCVIYCIHNYSLNLGRGASCDRFIVNVKLVILLGRIHYKGLCKYLLVYLLKKKKKILIIIAFYL